MVDGVLSLGWNTFTYSGNKKTEAHCDTTGNRDTRLRIPLHRALLLGANILYSHYNAGGVHFPFGFFPELKKQRFQRRLGCRRTGIWLRLVARKEQQMEPGNGAGTGSGLHTLYQIQLLREMRYRYEKKNKTFVMPTKLAVSLVYNIGPTDRMDNCRGRRSRRRLSSGG